MTNNIPKYAAYKPSGMDWLGEIPEHWEAIKIKYLFKEIKERSLDGNEDLLSVSQYTGVTKKSDKLEDGDLLTNALTLEGYKKVTYGDLVSNIMLAWNGSLGFSPHDGITSPAYSIYRLQGENDKGYFHYLLRSEIYKAEFKRNSSGVIESRLRLYTDDFYKILAILPPPKEQTAIANFLDHKTALIDQAIGIKEKQIELLKERRQILIHRAVTRGLNPDVKLKDSGVEWIGEIPEGWVLLVMNYAINAVADVDHYMPPTIESGIPYIMTGDLEEFASDIDFDGCKKVSQRDYCNLSKKIKSSLGDVILARYATIGTAAYIDIDLKFLVSYSCVTIKTNPTKLLGLYLFYYFKSDAFAIDIRNRVNTNTQGNVGIGDLKKVKLVLPPIDEQKDILEYIKTSTTKIATAISLKEQEIEKLKEYKASLINEAVTGKIKVN